MPAPAIASPKLQPIERVRTLVDEPVANRTFVNLDALENALVRRCQVVATDRATIKAHTHFYCASPCGTTLHLLTYVDARSILIA